jgi:hypothetical protein
MVHRIHKRNAGYGDNYTNSAEVHQATLNATEGATALNMGAAIEQNKVVEKQEQTNATSLENISIDNATYLQNNENVLNNDEADLKSDEEIPTFEVDSIELATPQLFSNDLMINDEEIDSQNHENKEEKDTEMFESSDIKENSEIPEIKEPEMFEKQDSEEDFEIPAFLRRQKN